MSLRVYIETTIPGAYHENRRDIDSAFRRQHTREWWERYGAHYNLVTSEVAGVPGLAGRTVARACHRRSG